MWVTDDDYNGEGCHWPVVSDCKVTTTLTAEAIALAKQAAVELLFEASGRQFGICESTYRPCGTRCEGFDDLNMWDLIDRRTPFYGRGEWVWERLHCGRCRTDTCSCENTESLRLWSSRVTEIVEVQIDGEALPSSSYRLDGRTLYRTDGERWPTCQDMNVTNYEPGSWSVTYRHGRPVPAGGRLAAGELSCELAKAICSDESCALPKRVQTVTRQGVTVGFIDPMDFLREGRTGLYTVDLWLNSVNPSRLRRRARVFRSDAPRTSRRAERPSGS